MAEALELYESKGYKAQLADTEGGDIKCFACGRSQHPDAFHVDARLRIEGASDPADMSLVAAVRCPSCGARGTLVLPFGSRVRLRDAEALRGIDASDTRTGWMTRE